MSLAARLEKALSTLRSRRARDLFWALVGQAGPTFLQLLYFIAAARILGAETTGNFFLIVATAVIGSSFVGFGAGGLVLREVSRDPARAATVFGQAQAISVLSFPLLLPLVAAGAWYVTGGQVALWVILAVASADLLAGRMLTTTWSLFIAREEQLRAALLICLMPLARMLIGLLSALWPVGQRLEVFAALYVLASFAVLALVLRIVRKIIGPAPLSVAGFDYRSGGSFSMTWLNIALQSESDKLLLGLFTSPAMVAVYAIAARLMDGAAMPPRALRVAIQARLFRAGAGGSNEAYRMARRIVPVITVYGLAVWAGFWLLAPLVARLFGPGFEALAQILPLLGVLPLLRGLAEFGAEIFMSSDRPAVQALTQSLMTALRIGLGVVLIATYQIEGAIATALLVSLISGTILWGLAWASSRPQR